jgi:hypothetical protein
MPIMRVILVAAGFLAGSGVMASLSAQRGGTEVTGTVQKVDVVLNRPGARCGTHPEITVVADDGRKIVLKIFDRRLLEAESLQKLEGKKIQADVVDNDIVRGIRLANQQQTAEAPLANVVTRSPC